jgi:hypothetical protein
VKGIAETKSARVHWHLQFASISLPQDFPSSHTDWPMQTAIA